MVNILQKVTIATLCVLCGPDNTLSRDHASQMLYMHWVHVQDYKCEWYGEDEVGRKRLINDLTIND